MENLFVLLVLAVVAAYLLPTIIAVARGHRRAGWLLLLNVTCGWMALGWCTSFLWAVCGETTHDLSEPEQDEGAVIEPDIDPDPEGGEPLRLLRRPVRERRPRLAPRRSNTQLRRVPGY